MIGFKRLVSHNITSFGAQIDTFIAVNAITH